MIFHSVAYVVIRDLIHNDQKAGKDGVKGLNFRPRSVQKKANDHTELTF